MVAVQERTLPVWQENQIAAIVVAGSGPPVVFLHGENGLSWDPFLDRLAQRHTVYAPRHPGTRPGDPDAIRSVDTLWDLVLYYADVFEGLGLDAPALIGHSFGGMVAAEIAATYSRWVSKLVLINPIGLWREDQPVRNWMAMKPDQLQRATYSDPEGPAARQAAAAAAERMANPEGIADGVWALACTGRFVWPIPDKGLKRRLYRIKAPTLLLWGRDDGLVPVVYADEFARRIEGSRVEIITGAAHLPHLEQTEGTAAAVEQFLAG